MELLDFCTYFSPTRTEHATRMDLIDWIKQIVTSLWPQGKVHLFGSMKTNLYLPTSDIDLAVFPQSLVVEDMNTQMHRLSNALEQSGKCSYLEIISSARVPLVKFTHSDSGVSVDIVFDRETGVIGADNVNMLQSRFPALRPLTYFLKYFLWFRGLNEPFRGGMGSYLLQMLIVHMIQVIEVLLIRKTRILCCFALWISFFCGNELNLFSV